MEYKNVISQKLKWQLPWAGESTEGGTQEKADHGHTKKKEVLRSK